MEKENPGYFCIKTWKALAWTGTLLALFIAYDVDNKGKIYDLICERHSEYRKQIAEHIDPNRMDVDHDGRKDLVFKLNSGNDLVLWNTDEGYKFYKKGENKMEKKVDGGGE